MRFISAVVLALVMLVLFFFLLWRHQKKKTVTPKMGGGDEGSFQHARVPRPHPPRPREQGAKEDFPRREKEEDLKARKPRPKARSPREAPLQEAEEVVEAAKETAVQSLAQRLVTERGYSMEKAMQIAEENPKLAETLLGSSMGSIDEHTPGYPRPGTGFNTDEDIKKGRKRYDG